MVRKLKTEEVEYISGAKAMEPIGGSEELESSQTADKEFEKSLYFKQRLNMWMDALMGRRFDATLAGIIPSYEENTTATTEHIYPYNAVGAGIAAFPAFIHLHHQRPVIVNKQPKET